MKLKNPFSLETRNLYLGIWECWECGMNGTNRGGLELHHIFGRVSASPFNSALLCGVCHRKCCHNIEEESKYFKITINFLSRIFYKPTEEDFGFIHTILKERLPMFTLK